MAVSEPTRDANRGCYRTIPRRTTHGIAVSDDEYANHRRRANISAGPPSQLYVFLQKIVNFPTFVALHFYAILPATEEIVNFRTAQDRPERPQWGAKKAIFH